MTNRAKSLTTLFSLVSLSLFVLSGCVTTEKALEPVNADILTLRQQITTTQEELATLRADIRKNTEQEIAPIKQDLKDLQQKFADHETLNEQANRDANIMGNRLDEYSDRMDQFEQKLAQSEQNTNDRVVSALKVLEDKISAIEQKLGNTQPSDTVSTDTSLSPSVKLLHSAEQNYLKGNYSDSARILNEYIEKYPAGEERPAVEYLLGQSLINLKDYPNALKVLNQFVQNWPDDERIPSVMLKRAQAYKAQNNTKDFRSELNALVKKYPLTPEAEQALEELNKR